MKFNTCTLSGTLQLALARLWQLLVANILTPMSREFKLCYGNIIWVHVMNGETQRYASCPLRSESTEKIDLHLKTF